jgi:hypothetical protein
MFQEQQTFAATGKVSPESGMATASDYYYYSEIKDYEQELDPCIITERRSATISAWDTAGVQSVVTTFPNGFFRDLRVADLVKARAGDEMLIQTWFGTGDWEPLDLTCHTTCLSLFDGIIDTIWTTATGKWIAHHFDHDARLLVGTTSLSRNKGFNDSLVIFYSSETGQPIDTVDVNRGLSVIKFFETGNDSRTLNMLGRHNDTVFVFQFQKPTEAEEPGLGTPLPKSFVLHNAYPNPFNSSTIIRMDNRRRQEVNVAVFNLLGQKVAVINDGELAAGIHSLTWDGIDLQGRPVVSGVYLLSVRTEIEQDSRKLILMK